MDVKELFTKCGETTKAKGFDVTQHNTQLLLIASEVAEAMECTALSDKSEQIEVYIFTIQKEVFNGCMHQLEEYRKEYKGEHVDNSYIKDYESLLEELADIQIRLASYVSGNNFTDDFIKALEAKMIKNEGRPYRHGKGF